MCTNSKKHDMIPMRRTEMSIAANIKELRKQNHMTQKQLAKKSGLAVITIQQYEAGKFNPKPDAVMKLCVGLNCKITDIIDDETQKYYRMFDNIQSNIHELSTFERALQKFQNKEDLTYEEENAIIEYVKSEHFKQEKEDIKQVAQDAYRHISYLHSYSYASSAEELDKLQDAKQIELERKRAKRFKLHEMEENGPPKPFTRPLQSSYDKPNEDYQDNSLKLHTNTRGIDWEQLDDFRFDELMLKLDRGEELTPAEINFKSAYLERCLKKVGYIFAKFYSMLNVEGQKKADEQIDRAIEQVELLTKIPEYQKKPDTPPQE